MATGGKRPGAGRKPGVPNKATGDVKALAQEWGEKAIKALADIATGPEHPAAARVSAASVLLDRGYGKAKQAVELSGPGGPPCRPKRRLGPSLPVGKLLTSNSSADFSDCLVERLASEVGCTKIVTFDRGAVGHAGMTMLGA